MHACPQKPQDTDSKSSSPTNAPQAKPVQNPTDQKTARTSAITAIKPAQKPCPDFFSPRPAAKSNDNLAVSESKANSTHAESEVDIANHASATPSGRRQSNNAGSSRQRPTTSTTASKRGDAAAQKKATGQNAQSVCEGDVSSVGQQYAVQKQEYAALAHGASYMTEQDVLALTHMETIDTRYVRVCVPA